MGLAVAEAGWWWWWDAVGSRNVRVARDESVGAGVGMDVRWESRKINVKGEL